MKKIIFLFIFLLSIQFNSVYAISGACSFHGGVNCKVVSAIDNSAICNDGWLSSVQYSDMEECQQNTNQSYCFPPVGSGCKNENDYAVLSMQNTVNGTSRYSPEISGGELQACRSQIISYQAKVLDYQNCLSSQQDNIIKPTPILIDKDAYVNSQMQKFCKNEYGESSYDSINKKCICNSGYEFANTNPLRCVLIPVKTNDQICKESYGQFSIASTTDKENCYCQKGYYFSTSTPRRCITIDNYYCSIKFSKDFVLDDNNKICVQKSIEKPITKPKAEVKQIKSENKKEINNISSTTIKLDYGYKATSTIPLKISTTTENKEVKTSLLFKIWKFIWRF